MTNLETPRKRLDPILSHEELDLPGHILVIDCFALFVVNSPSNLPRLLVSTCPPKLVEEAFPSHEPIQHSHRLVHIVVSGQDSSRDEHCMSVDHGRLVVVALE